MTSSGKQPLVTGGRITPQAVFYGASGHALALAGQARQSYGAPLFEVIAYIDDFQGDKGATLDGAPIISFGHWQQHYLDVPCLVSMGDPATRLKLAGRVADAGGSFANLFRPLPCISADLRIGVGCYISALVFIGTRCRIGNHVQVMPQSSLGHDVLLEDGATVCPGANVSGHVHIERGAFVGAGAVIVNGRPDRPLVIGEAAQIYAGSVVTKSVAAGARVAGNPARSIRDFLRRK